MQIDEKETTTAVDQSLDMDDKLASARAIKDRHPTETVESNLEDQLTLLRTTALAVVNSAHRFGRPINEEWGGYMDRTPESFKEGVMIPVSMRDIMRLRDILNGNA